jgi:hypothetical protein
LRPRGQSPQSWIGTGQHLPISADQFRKVFRSGVVAVTLGGNVPGQNDLSGAPSSLGKLLG